ncbi:MAG: cysteine peptidase family C39 domain-containing protein [Spirochaetota bacterium]
MKKRKFLYLLLLSQILLWDSNLYFFSKTQAKKRPKGLYIKRQRDSFSCGYLALMAVYDSYKFKYDRKKLRTRLRTNIPLIPFVKKTRGTTQLALLQVLQEDGFQYKILVPENSEDRKKLIQHIRGPHYALALIRRKHTASLHWVVVVAYRKGGYVLVADSLKWGKRKYSLKKFATKQVLSAILISPSNRSLAFPKFRGFWEIGFTSYQLLRKSNYMSKLYKELVIYSHSLVDSLKPSRKFKKKFLAYLKEKK